MIYLFPAFKYIPSLKSSSRRTGQPDCWVLRLPCMKTHIYTETTHTQLHAQADLQLCFIKHTHKQQAYRKKWVTPDSSVSPHLERTRSPTVSHTHVNIWSLHTHTHTQTTRNILMHSHSDISEHNLFTLRKANIFTFESNTHSHTHLHIHWLPFEHTDAPRSSTSAHMQSNKFIYSCMAKHMCLPKSQARDEMWIRKYVV